MLTRNSIKKAVEAGAIEILPYNDVNVGPHSYDVTLQNRLLTYVDIQNDSFRPKCVALDSRVDNPTYTTVIPDDGIMLYPNTLYLGSTIEHIFSPIYGCQFDGRSSVGRLGISTHQCAGYVDVGFRGNITLEISVIHPVRIYAGMRIGQISFFPLVGQVTLYNGKYQNAEGVESSKMHRDKPPGEVL